MQVPYRFAVCNEVFEKTPFIEACRLTHRLGYQGIEIAPFTLAESPADISQGDRLEYGRVMDSEGLAFVGVHWLMLSPPGLHVTTPDLSLRKRSWEHIVQLIDLCADLGEGSVLVFGSPKQRNTVGGMSPADGVRVFTEELAKIAPHAEQRGVRVLVEALPSNQCNVVNTLREAVAIVEEIGSPAVRTMFDTHNSVDETEAHSELIRRYFQYIAHIHVNEIDGREPGTGDYDFRTLLHTLTALDYAGWVSLEVFDFSRGAEAIVGDSIRHLQKVNS